MIIGTSLAAQGIIPSILDSIIGSKNTFNYAFAISASSYGPIYLESIKKKLNKENTDGLFIVAVTPWSISADKRFPNDPLEFRELETPVGKVKYVNSNPNFEYLLKSYTKAYSELWLNNSNQFLIHPDGWMEINVPMDSISLNERKSKRLKEYDTTRLPSQVFSELRFSYLEETVKYLQDFGDIYVVRMPISHELYQIDLQQMPNFDEKIELMCINAQVPYLNFVPDSSKFRYLDGNHLWKGSSKEFSIFLGERIKSIKGNSL